MPQLHTSLHFHLTPLDLIVRETRRDLPLLLHPLQGEPRDPALGNE
nr:hypothetical protein Q903MT_gene738 [Picea sitchensis]